jgi:hypothetical protein
VDEAATGDGQTEALTQQGSDLAERQAQLFIEHDGERYAFRWP